MYCNTIKPSTEGFIHFPPKSNQPTTRTALAADITRKLLPKEAISHLRLLLSSIASLSKRRSHLQGYSEEKVQKFRQLALFVRRTDKIDLAKRETQKGNSTSVIRDVFRIEMTLYYEIHA